MQKKLIVTVTEIVTSSSTIEVDVPEGIDITSYVRQLYVNDKLHNFEQDDLEIQSITVQAIE